jgi:hypothetical protein
LEITAGVIKHSIKLVTDELVRSEDSQRLWIVGESLVKEFA